MRARLNALLQRLGAAGILGVGVLFACAGFWNSALQPLERELAAQRRAAERLRPSTLAAAGTAGERAAEVRRFYALFPDSAELPAELERLHRLARRSGLELAQGEYRLERRSAGPWAYRVTLPVRGSYPQLREFLGSVLNDMPIASLDALRFERKRATDPQIEAQLRMTLHLRPSGDLP